MLYSIVIVAFKAEEQLLKCLKSLAVNPPEVREYSVKADAEIIIIDNSPEQLLGTEHNRFFTHLLQIYTRVVIEWHPENLGFAAGCNRGVELSGGDNIVLINPDTEVFPEWSERMASHLGPKVGAVGPISNFVAGWQQYRLHMQDAGDWAKTARYAIKGNDKRGVNTKMLIGFFVMIPRKIWDAVGGMDPQFFLGCDDLDLSLRLRDAGYSLIIASDVFVYHEGHASFYAAGSASMELNKQSETKMLAKLKAKYGDKIPTSTELWGCEILPTYVPKRQSLSVCMIVKDEQENILPFIDSLCLSPFVDELIIVDTGDRGTIAKLMGMDLLHMPLPKSDGEIGKGSYRDILTGFYSHHWRDNFAEARNFALSKCTGDWVLWLDADDRVSELSAKQIRAAMDNPGPMTQAKTCHFGLRLRDDGPDGFNFAEGQPRLFPRLPGIQWTGRVHESYMPATEAMGIQKVDCDIIIDHTGYKDPAVMLQKHARNLRLMRMEVDSPNKFYQMAKNLQGLGHYVESEACYNEVLSDRWGAPLDKPFYDQVRTCMASLIITVKGADESIDPFLENNDKPDALFLKAEVAFKRGNVFEAEAMYKEYAAFERIVDPFGSQQEYLQRVARERLQVIAGAREKVFGKAEA